MSSAKVVKTHCRADETRPVYDVELNDGKFLERFKSNFAINICQDDDEVLVFDMIGVSPAIANAFRRILLSEIPTVAIEKCFVLENTSLMQDEVLAHRLGLIPLRVDPRLMEFLEEGDDATEVNTAVLKIDVTAPDETNPDGTEKIFEVKSGHIEWVPQGSQDHSFPEPIQPVHEDIPITKLKPGQTLKVEMHAVKGIGREHAKWSPVSTAYYRLLPQIELQEDIVGEAADELVKKCPMNVFDIEDLGGGERKAFVARPRDCTMCRECIREPEWSNRVKLFRVNDHFIFSIESAGALSPKDIFREALRVFREKCEIAKSAVTEAAESL